MRDASKVKTKKLYYDDAYATRFTAQVVSCTGSDVVLDQTLFFPEEGGQSADRGVLNGCEVIDVQIREGEIHHLLKNEDPAAKPFSEGDTVSGEIDWEHRFSNMQQHSGEHLFSGMIHKAYGFDNVGFHLSDSEVTLDFDGVVPEEGIREAERKANQAIVSNIAVKVIFPTSEELETMDYRSKLELKNDVRIVEFSGVDACACCAPHVRRTGEIGLLKVISSQNYKGGVRISILCGFRALALLNHEHEILMKTANYLTTSSDEIYGLTVKMKTENAALRASLKKAVSENMLEKIHAVSEGEGNICFFEDDLEASAMRDAVNVLVEKKSGFCCVFSGSDDTGYKYIIGRKGGDAREAGKLLSQKFGARGGGQPQMIQGSVRAPRKELLELFEIGEL